MKRMHDADLIVRAAQAIRSADALLIAAGAGMGVDSGLPDFRGKNGFWNAYPAYRELGLEFANLATPALFTTDPALAWGFYGHRLNLYRRTAPHDGFGILLAWAAKTPAGHFVYTTNIDGHFQRAGFAPERIIEAHGSINMLQCAASCEAPLFRAGGLRVTIDERTMRATGPLPKCGRCGCIVRPNVVMFADTGFDHSGLVMQTRRLRQWLRNIKSVRLVVIEVGAGTAIPTVRDFGESLVNSRKATLVRINPRQATVPRGQIGLAMGALEAIRAIDEAIP